MRYLLFIVLILGCDASKNDESEIKTFTQNTNVTQITNTDKKLSQINSPCELIEEISKVISKLKSYKNSNPQLYHYIFVDCPFVSAAINEEERIKQEKAARFFNNKIQKEKIIEIEKLIKRGTALIEVGDKRYTKAEFLECETINNNDALAGDMEKYLGTFTQSIMKYLISNF